MKRQIINILIISALLVGCAINTPELTEQMATTSQLSLSSTPSEPVTATAVSLTPVKNNTTGIAPSQTKTISVTPQHTITPTLAPTPIKGIKQQCLSVFDNLFSAKHNIQGKIPLVATTFRIDDSYLINLETEQKTNLPTGKMEFLIDGATSTNSDWFAYVVTKEPLSENRSLIIINLNGFLVERIDLNSLQEVKNNTGLNEWIDNEHLILLWLGEDAVEVASPYYGRTVKLNPFTGEYEEYTSKYPEIYDLYPDFGNKWDDYNVTLSVYNSTFDRVLFLSYDGVVLWDVINQRPIKLLSDDAFKNVNRPVWSLDGEEFVIDLETTSGRNLFLVSKNGEEKQVTFLSGYHVGDFINFSWSPDNNLIAFWLFSEKEQRGPENFYDLVILDLNTLELKNFCLTAYNWRDINVELYPIWSPSSRELLIATQNRIDHQASIVVIVDLINNRAYEIAENVIPLGWMRAN